MAEKNTPLVCGGIYRTKNKKGASIYTAMIVSLVEPSNGKGKLGLLQVIGFADERVSEGSDRLNEFELIYSPAIAAPKKKRTTKKAADSK
tara:strand:+ start:980 stop:1249 length:270 start_codon:yes stop_codon:yes gene_type:complete